MGCVIGLDLTNLGLDVQARTIVCAHHGIDMVPYFVEETEKGKTLLLEVHFFFQYIAL